MIALLADRQSATGKGLAIIRIIVGLWFAKALTTKLMLLGGVVPVPLASERWIETMPKIVARQMAEHPDNAYKRFVEGTVLPNAPLFAHLTALGEATAGTFLVLGLFSGAGALIGLLLTLNYAMATWHMSPASQGFHWTLIAVMIGLFVGRAGFTWGLDAFLLGRKGDWWGSRRPLA